MPIDHCTRLPLSATMATWLAALQLYISRQEGSGDVFSVQDSHRVLRALMSFWPLLGLYLPTMPRRLTSQKEKQEKDEVHRSFFFRGCIQVILASPATQTHSVIQNIVFLNQTPCSFNLPVRHTGYSSAGSAWGFTPCCTQMVIYIMWSSAVQALCSGDKEEFRWGDKMNVLLWTKMI